VILSVSNRWVSKTNPSLYIMPIVYYCINQSVAALAVIKLTQYCILLFVYFCIYLFLYLFIYAFIYLRIYLFPYLFIFVFPYLFISAFFPIVRVRLFYQSYHSFIYYDWYLCLSLFTFYSYSIPTDKWKTIILFFVQYPVRISV
jgi:hypothetical protein